MKKLFTIVILALCASIAWADDLEETFDVKQGRMAVDRLDAALGAADDIDNSPKINENPEINQNFEIGEVEAAEDIETGENFGGDFEIAQGQYQEDEKIEEKQPFSFKRRFEFGYNVGFGFSNNFLGFDDIFQKTLVVDLGKLEKGLKFDVTLNVPLFFNFNYKDDWGFGLFTIIDVAGNIGVSGNLLNFKEIEDDKFGVGAAVFAETGAYAFFHIKKFKVKVDAAFYYPAAYMEPDISYTFKTTSGGGLKAVINYDMMLYTAFSLENFTALTGHGGVDWGGGVEYPLFPFLDLGATITHIPLVPAELNDYMKLSGKVGIETDDLFGALMDGGDMDSLLTMEDPTPEYGRGKKTILRPFKLVFDADYRPFNTKLLSLKPKLGFALSPLYVQPFSMEGGLTIQTNVIDLFVFGIGINYTDHLWKNHVALALNFRAFELDIGLALQSEDFVKSWSSGLDVLLGMKVGF